MRRLPSTSKKSWLVDVSRGSAWRKVLFFTDTAMDIGERARGRWYVEKFGDGIGAIMQPTGTRHMPISTTCLYRGDSHAWPCLTGE